MPMPMIIAKMMLEVKVQCLKSSSGMIGSLALDSTSTKSAARTTVRDEQPDAGRRGPALAPDRPN